MEKNNQLGLVSICMPSYNAGKYIQETINSILNQSYQNFELIIVNDGSTDDTWEILQSQKDNRIKIFNTGNQGQCAAANLAYSHSKGDYIKFMDADDLISENFLELQVNRISNHPNTIASAEWGRFYGDDLSTFKLNPETVWRDMKPIDWLCESLQTGQNMMQCALWLIPRNVLNRSGLWNEKLSLINDFDFFIRVLLSSKEIRFAKNAILYYRSGLNSSLSNQKSRNAYLSAFNSINFGLNTLINFEESERTKMIAADIYKEWSFEFYPSQMDLYLSAIENSKNFGKSNVKFHAGNLTLVLSRIIGWKLTKRIKYFLNRL